jgi:hypothetical protein
MASAPKTVAEAIEACKAWITIEKYVDCSDVDDAMMDVVDELIGQDYGEIAPEQLADVVMIARKSAWFLADLVTALCKYEPQEWDDCRWDLSDGASEALYQKYGDVVGKIDWTGFDT